MNRFLTGVALAAATTTAAYGASAPNPPTTAAAAAAAQGAEPALSENYFLKAAQDSANSGDSDAAVQLWQSAIVYAPDDPVPYQQLAEFFAHSGQNELAQQYFSLALEVQPAYAPALRGIAMLDLASGNRAGAVAQRDILLHACGASCPETAQVEKALGESGGVLDRTASPK